MNDTAGSVVVRREGPVAVVTIEAIADSLYDEVKEPLYTALPLLARMVDAGLLGKKSGRGFYLY